jgi:hypothetical protein
VAATVLASLLALYPSTAAAQIAVSIHIGFAFNFRTPLTVRQQDEATLRLRANYASRPFALPLYYGVRVEWWKGEAAWGLEFIHQKLYLQSRPPEIEHFEISHGYNMIFIDRGWRSGRETLQAGAGIILAHPEAVVRKEAAGWRRTARHGIRCRRSGRADRGNSHGRDRSFVRCGW